MLILIDPGHGGEESGAVANGYKEKDLNLQFALKLEKLLKKKADVQLTRNTDVKMPLQDRGRLAKDIKADLLLSIHFNAFDGKARGVEVIHSIKAKQDTVTLAYDIAKSITGLRIPFRRVFSKESDKYPGQDWYGIPRYALPVPALIVESLFIDNEQDVKFLKTPEALDRLAEAIAAALIQHCCLSERDKAIRTLQDVGIIGVPEYWANNAQAGKQVKGEFTEKLIISMAEYIKKGGG
jgi:N-acetylmuramoyl-L-alanine amidase